MTLGLVVSILISGLFTGALARLALPGPDPMPLWMTIAIGLTGSIAGAVLGNAISNGNGYVVSFLSLGIAIALVAAYRKYVQKRPVWGTAARAEQAEHYRGLERMRLEAMLRELHRAGLLDDEELAAKRERLRTRQAER
ncbi:MAG TPA: hypothetical protein VFA05_00825 [Gaiellaceae bacterium]|nr:hypothetical protein [Gaiellaceae bacterium]